MQFIHEICLLFNKKQVYYYIVSDLCIKLCLLGRGGCQLASASPRREELLKQIRVDYTVVPHGINEARLPQESAKDMVERLAIAKAH
jgi:hypothetical protein